MKAELDDGGAEIEVVYARPHDPVVIALRVPCGTTAAEAIALSGVTGRCAEIAQRQVEVGIYGRRVSLTTVLAAGDRLEIYRALVADPKQARRQRARKPA